MSYQQEYRLSIEDPAGFWAEKARLIEWYQYPQTSLTTDEQGIQRWYADGKLNTCYLALDYHIEQGRGESIGAHLRFSCQRAENKPLPISNYATRSRAARVC